MAGVDKSVDSNFEPDDARLEGRGNEGVRAGLGRGFVGGTGDDGVLLLGHLTCGATG
jgi:hypothetical protein